MKKLFVFLFLMIPVFAFAEEEDIIETEPVVLSKIVKSTPVALPNEFTTLEGDIGHFLLYGPMEDSRPFVEALRYFVDADVERMVIEIHTSGGYSRVMQRIVGYIDSYRGKIIFETRVYGIASSAGFIVFVAGDERYMSKNMSYLFWHNPSPSGRNPYKDPLPEDVQMMEILKDWADGYIASRSDKISINRVRLEIEDNIWMIFAEESIELGLATGYIEDIAK